MAKAERLPSDILKIVNKVNKQQVKLNIKGKETNISRSKYDQLMKSDLFFFEDDSHFPGFYIADKKQRKAILVMPLPSLKRADVVIQVNDRSFKVNQKWRGFTYD